MKLEDYKKIFGNYAYEDLTHYKKQKQKINNSDGEIKWMNSKK